MHVLYFVLYLLAVISFVIAAFHVVADRRVNFLALGLVFAVLVPLIQQVRLL